MQAAAPDAPLRDEAAELGHRLVAAGYDAKLTVAKLDIDANPSTPGKYGIRGIPTVILYKDGQPHAQNGLARPLLPMTPRSGRRNGTP